ncbi:transposase [Gammaproteobacteria bacterium]
MIAATNNIGKKPFIINGKPIKSVNQFYNKTKTKLMSYIGDKGTSNRIKKITFHRNNYIEDKLHKISRFIINYCVENKIGTIIIGHNKEWKQEINIGKRNNQKFVNIPHSKLIDKIIYKAFLVGIKVITPEESYTSKIDALALEPLKKHEVYLGKRIRRGLFQSSIGKLINADINGSINIARKVVGNCFAKSIINSGLAFSPCKINIL